MEIDINNWVNKNISIWEVNDLSDVKEVLKDFKKDYDKLLNLPVVSRSNRKETLKNFQEIEMILKEAKEEVNNGIYDPILEALSIIINKYVIIKK